MTSVQDLFSNYKNKKEEESKKISEARDSITAPLDHSEIKKAVESIIQTSTIIVFSKSYCPYCRQAKMALRSISDLEFLVIEMDDGSYDGWQACVAEIAKQKAVPETINNNTLSVPQIFINQKYIGGADDLSDMFCDERLSKMLGRPLS
jgi:glutaredoxin 3